MAKIGAKVLAIAVLIAVSLSVPQTSADAAPEVKDSPLTEVLDRLGITAPFDIVERLPIANQLEILAREKCDTSAIDALGKELQDVGYKRDAANAHINFAKDCGNRYQSIRIASNIFLNLSDIEKAVETAELLIKERPHDYHGYHLRALAFDAGNEPQRAIDDYITSIELFGNKSQISSSVYLALSRAYEKTGQICEAAGPIEQWVALNPPTNDTSQTRTIISDYRKRGKCPAAAGGKTEVFSSASGGGVTIVQADINGQRGNFVVDTGATFVALKRSFAERAKIDADPRSLVILNTANGVTHAQRGKASAIQLLSLSASNVALVIQDDAQASYGAKVDGLLGMSFLSRFQIALDGRNIKISAKGGGADEAVKNAVAPPKPQAETPKAKTADGKAPSAAPSTTSSITREKRKKSAPQPAQKQKSFFDVF